MPRNECADLLDNIRFYIVSGAVLVSLLAVCYLRTAIPDNRLYGIRLEEVFGLLSICFWYAALIITPLSKVCSERRWVPGLKFSRRALGVAAAYYALLHTFIALFGQLGGFSGLAFLPARFRLAVIFGFMAVIVLTLMMLTSFDRAIKFMTFRYWKWLHRLVYVAGVLAILHIWIIGSHAGGSVVQLIAFLSLVLLFGLEAIRLSMLVLKRGTRVTAARAFGLVVFVVLCLGLVAMRYGVESYANDHQDHAGELGETSHDHP